MHRRAAPETRAPAGIGPLDLFHLQQDLGPGRGRAVGRVGGGRQQRAGVGVPPFGQNLGRRPGLHDLALAHDGDTVGHARDHGKVHG